VDVPDVSVDLGLVAEPAPVVDEPDPIVDESFVVPLWWPFRLDPLEVVADPVLVDVSAP